jgi:hypothetical protein
MYETGGHISVRVQREVRCGAHTCLVKGFAVRAAEDPPASRSETIRNLRVNNTKPE